MRRPWVIREHVQPWLLVLLVHAPCAVHADLLIGSTAHDGGRLLLLGDRRTMARVSFSDALGDLSVYTATEPGFEGLRTNLRGYRRFPLRIGTAIWVELVDTGGGRASLKVRDTLLTQAGERARLGKHGGPRRPLHRDPEYLLLLDRPRGAFGDATLGLRLLADGYGASRVYRVRLSNGHLHPVDLSPLHFDGRALACQHLLGERALRFARAVWMLAPAATPDAGTQVESIRTEAHTDLVGICGPSGSRDYDGTQLDAYLDLARVHVTELVTRAGEAASADCRAALLKHGRTLMSARIRAVTACLLAAQRLHATEAAQATTLQAGRVDRDLMRRLAAQRAAAEFRVDAACADAHVPARDSDTLLGRVIRAQTQATRSTARACRRRNGDPGPATVARFLRTVACRADDLVSAAYATAKEDLSEQRTRRSQGGRPLSAYFPCLSGGAE